jgi:putative Ca2+/H+ antiporter (TMEM165/GDT1 family)
METLFNSTIAVAIAEIGDKTQLLSLLLAARFKQRHLIILGILVATLVNHGISAWLGAWLTALIPEDMGKWLIGGSFILIALWVLIPDSEEDVPDKVEKYGAFAATLMLFFLAEIGDKTQIATVILAAQYGSIFWVTIGTTLGMLIANVPVVYAGAWLLEKISFKYARWAACAVFALMGIAIIVGL